MRQALAMKFDMVRDGSYRSIEKYHNHRPLHLAYFSGMVLRNGVKEWCYGMVSINGIKEWC